MSLPQGEMHMQLYGPKRSNCTVHDTRVAQKYTHVRELKSRAQN